jgi:2-oxoacid:acceptor oxidoreductase delta subunit (pyruvate/2-ketoisovalerate family)
VNITEGLKDHGMLILNSSIPPDEIELLKPYKVATVDATGIALETLGRPITNTAILGALAKATGEIRLESIIDAVKQQWKRRLGEINVKAVEAAYEATAIGDPNIVAEVILEKPPAGSRADWRTLRPIVDAEKCTGCLLCWVYCPDNCIEMVNKISVIDYTYCKGCGICVEECPVDAIEMKSECARVGAIL